MKTQSSLLLFALLAFSAGPMLAAEAKDAAPSKKSADQVEPSEEFRAFVASLRIEQVFISTEGSEGNRVLLNQRSFREGDLVQKQHGVRLVEIDGDHKRLVFQDKTGARVVQSYGPGK